MEEVFFFAKINQELVFVEGFLDCAYPQTFDDKQNYKIEYVEVVLIKSITKNKYLKLTDIKNEVFYDLEKQYFDHRQEFYSEND